MRNRLQFEKLFEPGRIGEMTIRNRLVMPGIPGYTHSDDCFVSDITKDYYEARAKGGTGLIIVGHGVVDWPLGIIAKSRLSIHDDKFISGLAELVEVIHQHGSKAAI